MFGNSEYLIKNKKIKLLDRFSADDRIEFLSFGTVKEFNLQETIITEKHDDVNIYLILEGEVSVWRKNLPIFRLKSGEVFNESKIFYPRTTNTVTVVSEKQTLMFIIGRKEVLNYFSLKPERLFKIFTLNIVSILSKKLEGFEEKIVDLHVLSHLRSE